MRPKSKRAPAVVWRSRKSASSSIAARSSAIRSRMFGRCTFTATLRPSRSCARCTGQRLGFERCDPFRQPHPQIFLDDALHFGERERFEGVLQARQRLQVPFGKQVSTGGKQLPQLYERRAELFEVARKLVRVL